MPKLVWRHALYPLVIIVNLGLGACSNLSLILGDDNKSYFTFTASSTVDTFPTCEQGWRCSGPEFGSSPQTITESAVVID